MRKFKLRLYVGILRFLGWRHGLPSLRGYTAEQIAEGFRRRKDEAG